LLKGLDSLFEGKEEIIGSLNRISLHQFKYNSEEIPMVHLFGLKLIKKIQPEEM